MSDKELSAKELELVDAIIYETKKLNRLAAASATAADELEKSAANIRYREAKDAEREQQGVISELERQYAELCEGVYAQDGIKQFNIGKINITNKPVYDAKAAISWAFEHKHVRFLTLNRSNFEKAAKADPEGYPFFELVEVPVIRFDRKAIEAMTGDNNE